MHLSTQCHQALARIGTATLWAALAASLAGCGFYQDWRDENKGIQLDSLKAPPGYKVSVLATGLPKARHMVMGTGGTLFVGSMAGNVYALTMNGSAVTQQRTVVKGLTDPSGVAFHNGALFVADRTRIVRFDNIEQQLDNPGAPPNDELNRVTKVGENFGFPYCHDRDIADPEFGKKRACSEFTPPVFGLGAHTAALGMRFDTTAQSNGAVSMLVARHGSHPPTRVGYDVMRVTMRPGQAPRIEPFLTGFLQGRSYWGRPVDVLVMRDGSVLVSDDLNGAIYRVARER